MKSFGVLTAIVMLLGIELSPNSVRAQLQPQLDHEDGIQVLTRGPVHEAFAETVVFDSEPDFEVPGAPPDPIEEIPPDQRPDGDNVTWVPGYWAWEDERNDFLWVSGVWRSLPPGRQWMSGYWGRSERGFRWTSGYWADARSNEVEYLPEPPDTVEAGPNIEAPSVDYSWIPGCWVWHQGHYAWRPGYWERVQPDWNWVPDHYVSAPRGYVFVNGYWDYPVGRRGVLFAPIYFDARVRVQPGFRYSPATVIDLGVFSDHLFVRARSRHYYFGDYYASSYRDAGYYPRFSFQSSRYGYDPIYAHQRWHHRQDRDWEQRVELDFQYRRDHVDARPPRTLALQVQLGESYVKSRERSVVVATSLDRLAKSQDSAVRFRSVDPEERQQLTQRRQAVQKFREDRQKLESYTAERSADQRERETAPARVPTPRSPIVAKRAEELSKDRAPPRIQKAPDVDPKVKPKPKKKASKRQSSNSAPNKEWEGP